jgi:hypothetical protein
VTGRSGPDVPWATATPFAGFDVQVLTDRHVYVEGQPVRITVSATNHGERFVEHRYPGWQRFELTVRDASHHVVAEDLVDRRADHDAIDRWLPGQMVLWPVYWAQTAGVLVPERAGAPVGPRVPPGRYRIRVAWLGREPGVQMRGPEATSAWFEVV